MTTSNSTILNNSSLNAFGLQFQYLNLKVVATGDPKKPYKKQLDPHPRLNCRGSMIDFEFKPHEVKPRMLPENKTDVVGLDTRFIAQVDIDGPEGIDPDALKWMYANCPYFLSMRNRLPHFLIKIEQQPWKRGKRKNDKGQIVDCIDNSVTVLNVPHSKDRAADILHGTWSFMKTDEELLNPHLAGNIPSFLTPEAVKEFIRIKSPNIEMCIAAAPPSASVLCTAKPKPTIQKPQQTPSNEVDTSLQQPLANDDILLFIKELKQEHTDHDEGRTFKTMAWSLKSHAGDKYKDDMMCAGKQSSYAKHDYDVWFNRLWLFNLDGQVPKPITIGSFYFLVRKLLGDEIYYKIKTKMFTPSDDVNAYRVASDFHKLQGDDWLFCKQKRYVFDNRLWKYDEGEGHFMQHRLQNSLKIAYGSLWCQANLNGNKENLTKQQKQMFDDDRNLYNKLIGKLAKQTFLKECIWHFNTLAMLSTDQDMVFNQNFDTFYFKNCVFDLKTGMIVQPDREHYATMTCGFPFVEPTKMQLDKVQKLLDTTLPIPEERELYMHIIASGLSGRQLPYINIINGSGGNGKSTVHALLRSLCGNYHHEVNTSNLANKQSSEKSVDLAALDYVRLITASEPDENAGFLVGIMKNITGNDTINSRTNYSNNTVVNMCGTLLIECNRKPKLNGRMDDAIERRLMDVPFRSTFKTNPKEAYGDYIFEKDESFISREFPKEHRCALFRLLLPYVRKLYDRNFNIDNLVPDSVKERNRDYMASSDEFKNWLDDNYERVKDKNVFEHAKGMYEVYKETQFFHLSKKQCREHTKKWFIDELQTNMFTKADFKIRHKEYYSCLVGWGKRPPGTNLVS